jgi:NAD(P)-dependent dehydrogenase (short-subunit alcohol dehydrogenase family)
MNGKLAVVTGGANGIGAAAARLLAARGAEVCVFDREAPAEESGAKYFCVDVTSRQSIDAGFSAVGTPDIVMVNAGIAEEEDFLAHGSERWERILSINLSGAFHTIQAAAQLMKARRCGSIVITASTNSYDGEARLAAYNASKAGLLGLVHTAANELGPHQIRVNAVCPGLIRTRLTERHFSNPEVLREYFRQIPLGRGGSAEEVAQACVFLASDDASYITGATLLVDGGQMATKFGPWSDNSADFSEGRWRLR